MDGNGGLRGGNGGREAAMAEVRRHTRLLPDPVPEPLGGEARAGGGDSEAREGPTGAGGALGKSPPKIS